MAKVYDADLAAKLKRLGTWPLSAAETEIPDDWLALLDHLHGQSDPNDGSDRRQGDRS